ncbi:MAG: baseplate protein [Thaumarchaeota archaeon]|jgi:hypothetical protein|nr:baseplate protein [Nitrososphaerota archaeon]
MALPVLSHPTFDLTIPSSKEKVVYRPFLVKEEKILLLAQEANEIKDLTRSVKQIINNCIVEGELDVQNAPTFDLEYIFLKLRANSVSDLAKFKISDEETQKEVDIELDLKDVEIHYTDGHDSKIKLNDVVSLQMRYPTYETIGTIDENVNQVKATFDMIKACIDKVLVGEDEVHEFKDYSNSEVDAFIDSLTSQNFQDVQKFFDTMPRLEHTVEYKIGKRTKTRTFSGLADFFT